MFVLRNIILGSRWYKGYVHTVHAATVDGASATYDVQYDDGDFETGQKPSLMRPLRTEPDVYVINWKLVKSKLVIALEPAYSSSSNHVCVGVFARFWDAIILLVVVFGSALGALSLTAWVIRACVNNTCRRNAA